MEFLLQQATAADTHECGVVLEKSFLKDPLIPQLLANVKPEDRIAFWAAFLLDEIDKPGEKLWKIVENSSGKIVAISKERWPAPKEVEEEAEPTFPTGANVALFKHWGEVMGKFHARDANPETDFYLNIICVLSEYLGKGLGARLLQNLVENVDRAGAKAYLQATTPKSVALYGKYGFVDRGDMRFETPDGRVVWKSMVREARSVEV